MKLACPVLGDSLRARIEHHTRQRFSVIDRFLNEQLGAIWFQRPRLISGDPSQIRRKDLWEFALQSNVLLRLLKAGKFDSQLPSLTIDAFRFHANGRDISYLGASQPLTDDLATAWHPQFHGRSVFPACSDFELIGQRTHKALELLAPYPDIIELVLTECGAICLIGADPQMEEGQCISLASKMVPGLIYVSLTTPIILAESLVHESAHLRFRALEEVTDLYTGGLDMRVKTPLREDLRPISGLMHQLVVLRYLAALYEKLQTSAEETIARQRPQVEKRFHVHLQDLETGKSMAKGVASALTPNGRRLLEWLLEDSEPILL